jgi:hypothetical protein
VSDSADNRKREAIQDTARIYREASARNGQPISQTQAENRVREAVRQGDRKRENGNR